MKIMKEKLLSLIPYFTFDLQSWTVLQFLQTSAAFTLLLWYLQFLWRRRKLYEYTWRMPGPFSLPLIGSALSFIGNPYEIFTKVMEMYNTYPDTFRVWLGTYLFVAVSNPKDYEILLPSCLQKQCWYQSAQSVVGYGLFTAPLHVWKRHRKMIMPTFNQKILNSFMDVFCEQSEEFAEQMEEVVGTGNFDMFEKLSPRTVSIVCETAMGVKTSRQERNGVTVSKYIDKIMEVIFLRMFVIWYQMDALFNLSPRSKEFKASVKNLHEFSGAMVRKKKKLWDINKQKNLSFEQFSDEGPKRKAFLDYLMDVTSAEGSRFTEKELREEVDTFLIAGSDTTASTGSYIFVTLGIHKDLQEKVYQEIMEVVGPTRPIEHEDLVKLTYTERFIKETLRLFPVAAFIVRDIEEDKDLGDFVLPAGAAVIFGILKTHTSEKYWPDPYKFDPDRFLPEEVAKRHPCAYLPFSYGPRNCIGLKYAMMVMKVMVVTMLRKYKVSTPYKSVRDVKLKTNLVLRPRDGYMVSLELRK